MPTQMPSYGDSLPLYHQDNSYPQEEKKPNPNFLHHHHHEDSLVPPSYNPSQQASYSQPPNFGTSLSYPLNPGYPTSPTHRPQYVPGVSSVGLTSPGYFSMGGYSMNNYSNIPPYPKSNLGQHEPA
jgi:hypothetical protein